MAKNMNEDQLWQMSLGDYYSTVASFNKYVEIQNELIKNKE
jgi:hypothetical protein